MHMCLGRDIQRMVTSSHTYGAQRLDLIAQRAFIIYPLSGAGGNPPVNSTVTVNSLGQFEGVQCPVGYTCQYQDATYSLCKFQVHLISLHF